MKKIDIVWFIEHISRELDVAVAVSVLLNKKYHKSIKIVPLSSVSVFKEFKPAIVLLPFCYSIKDITLKKCLKYWSEAVFINLSWEQIFYKANLEYKTPRDLFAKKFVYHHAWSLKRKKFLMEKGIPENKIFVNGHPAYRLYGAPYRKVFITKKGLAKILGLDYRKKWLFFPENYSWYFYSEYNIKEIIKQGQSAEVISAMRKYCGEALLEVLDWLNQAIGKYGDKFEFILRPRPAFSLEYFKNKVEKLYPQISPKLHLIKDYSVREWILASDIVISSFSTSLIEAAIAQKPVYMLDPVSIPQELKAKWYDLLPKLKSVKNFFDILRKEGSDKSFTDLKRWAKKEFLISGDPITGLVDFLGKLDPRKSKNNLTDLKKIISESEILKSGLKEQVIRALGSVKRKMIADKSYFQNDDLNKYEAEINYKLKSYQNLLKV